MTAASAETTCATAPRAEPSGTYVQGSESSSGSAPMHVSLPVIQWYCTGRESEPASHSSSHSAHTVKL